LAAWEALVCAKAASGVACHIAGSVWLHFQEGPVALCGCRALQSFLRPAQIVINWRQKTECRHVIEENRAGLSATLQAKFKFGVGFSKRSILQVRFTQIVVA